VYLTRCWVVQLCFVLSGKRQAGQLFAPPIKEVTLIVNRPELAQQIYINATNEKLALISLLKRNEKVRKANSDKTQAELVENLDVRILASNRSISVDALHRQCDVLPTLQRRLSMISRR